MPRLIAALGPQAIVATDSLHDICHNYGPSDARSDCPCGQYYFKFLCGHLRQLYPYKCGRTVSVYDNTVFCNRSAVRYEIDRPRINRNCPSCVGNGGIHGGGGDGGDGADDYGDLHGSNTGSNGGGSTSGYTWGSGPTGNMQAPSMTTTRASFSPASESTGYMQVPPMTTTNAISRPAGRSYPSAYDMSVQNQELMVRAYSSGYSSYNENQEGHWTLDQAHGDPTSSSSYSQVYSYGADMTGPTAQVQGEMLGRPEPRSEGGRRRGGAYHDANHHHSPGPTS